MQTSDSHWYRTILSQRYYRYASLLALTIRIKQRVCQNTKGIKICFNQEPALKQCTAHMEIASQCLSLLGPRFKSIAIHD